MKFSAEQEPWNVYRFEDGTEVRLRVILVSVRRRENEFRENGDPVYDMNFQQLLHIEAAENLKAIHSAPSTATRQ